MKLKAILFITISLFSLNVFGQKFKREISAENSAIYCSTCKVESGNVPFLIVVKHRKEEKALEKAKVAAIMKILVSGVAGSPVSQGLVTATQYDSNEKFFDDFFESKANERYVSEATINPEKTFRIKSGPFKNGYEAGIDVVVQYDNLKAYLTEKKIIKFGL
jgi:hypothetical protein